MFCKRAPAWSPVPRTPTEACFKVTKGHHLKKSEGLQLVISSLKWFNPVVIQSANWRTDLLRLSFSTPARVATTPRTSLVTGKFDNRTEWWVFSWHNMAAAVVSCFSICSIVSSSLWEPPFLLVPWDVLFKWYFAEITEKFVSKKWHYQIS